MGIIARIVRAFGLLAVFSLVTMKPFFSPLAVIAAETAQVQIYGLEGEPLENVEAILKPPPGIVQPDGTVNLPLLKRFEQDTPERVQEALEPYGYYESRVETDLRKIPQGAYELAVRVNPGEPVRVGSARVNLEGPGREEGDLTRVVRRFPLRTGDILRHDQYEKGKSEIRSRAVRLGYLDADFITHLITVNMAEKKAHIDLVLVTGKRYFFNGVSFSGTDSYPDRFLKRYLTFKKGEPFSYAKLAETQVNLRNSERFTDISVTADRSSTKDDRVPIHIKLAEAPTKRLRMGAGYQTDTGPRFSLLYQDMNILDRGHELDAELNIAELIQGIAGRYIIPSSRNLLSYTAFRFNLQREDVPTYTTSLAMFEVDRERGLGAGRTAGVFLRFLYEDSDIGGERNRSYLTLPGVRFVAQDYNNPIRPTRGYYFSGELRGTTSFFASDQTFVQFVSQGLYLRRISRRFTVHLRAQVGVTVQKESLDDLPASLRFFAGGDRSVRGYAYQSLGPRDDEGEVIGGKNLFVGSVELERALGEDWGIAAFYDTGNAFNDISQIRLFHGVGLGVRYYTKVGPIKLDIARPLDKGSPVVRIHLSFGIGT